MMGDVGVVIENSLRRLIRSSRAYDVVWVMGSSNYSVLSNQLYQSRTPKVDQDGCRMLSKTFYPRYSTPTTASSMSTDTGGGLSDRSWAAIVETGDICTS